MIILVVVGLAASAVLIYVAGYVQGRSTSKMESNRWWSMHEAVKAKSLQTRREKRSSSAKKGHETRKRRVKALTKTECDY